MFILFIIIVAVLFVILFTLSPQNALNYADSIDLILSASSKGLAHPPGYPLLVLLLNYAFHLFYPQNVLIIANFIHAFLSSISLGLMWVWLVVITKPYLGKIISLLFCLSFTLFYITTPLIWRLSLIPEINALSLIFCLLWLIYLSLIITNTAFIQQPICALLAGTIFILTVSHHPLTLGLVTLSLVATVYIKKSFPFPALFILGIVIGLILVGCSYRALANSQDYSWPVPTSFSQWWEFWLRKPYAQTGSAIENLVTNFSPTQMGLSLLTYFFYLVNEFKFLLVLFIPSLYLLIKHQPKFRWLAFLYIIYGVGLTLYLKFPNWYSLNESAVWYGTALRERMYYLNHLLVISITALGLSLIIQKMPRLVSSFLTLLFLLISLANLYSSIRFTNMADANASSALIKSVIESIPEKSLLIVDSDEIFAFMFQQKFSPPKNIDIISPNIIVKPKWWMLNRDNFLSHRITPNKKLLMADLITTAFYKNQRVFLFGIDPNVMVFLGLEGNPFYAIPYGTTIEISPIPTLATPINLGVIQQLASIRTTNTDSWFKGFRAVLGEILATNSYYAQRLAQPQLAAIYQDFAVNLVYNSTSITQIKDLNTRAVNLTTTNGSYYFYQPLSSTQYLTLAKQAYNEQQPDKIYYYLTRAFLIDPYNPSVNQELIKWCQVNQKNEDLLFFESLNYKNVDF